MYSRNRTRDFLSRLAPYGLKSVHSNEAFRIPQNGRFLFLKVYGPKKPRIFYELRSRLDAIGMRQPIEYRVPPRRKDFEEACLKHWREKGFSVPHLLASPFPEYEGVPHLCTTFIEGVTMKSILSQGYFSAEGRLDIFFEDLFRRHALAFRTSDTLLFHIDANTQNILEAGNQFYHVDFEMGRPWERPMECACREITKLLISMSQDLPSGERNPLYRLFKKVYRNRDLLDFLDRSIHRRPFQNVHRWRNRRKKEEDPRRVTLYDLAEALQDTTEERPQTPPIKKESHDGCLP
jgi:tRNA A-37 threonylcarbamoyl transferase component Bud32